MIDRDMLFEPLFAHADAKPLDVAIHDDRGTWTYQQVAAMAAGLGMYLSFQTRKPTVGILLPAGVGFAASFYGTLLAGKAVVPINFLLGDREIAHVIKDSDIDTVITATPLLPRLAGMADLKVIDLLQLPPTPPAAIKPHFPEVTADDLAVLMYTSGTSGLPKGVRLTYGNLQSDVNAAIEFAALKSQHVFLGVIPLFHAFGMTAMMLAPIQLGAPVIYMSRFSAVGAVQHIRERGVSLMFGVPSMFGAMLHLKNASADDFKSIYAMISGGEPLSSPIRDGFRDRFKVNLLEGFGLTETSPVVALNVPQDFRVGSVGKPLPGVTVKVVDENNNPLPQGQQGEVWLKGPMVMTGYHNLPDATAEALTADGYFKTGDLGHVDQDGFLFITGRKKDLIIVAGEKASPREIEEAILKNASVGDAAVVGKKDPGRGEVVVAFVTAKEGQTVTAEQVKETCRQHGLPQWKIPREVHVVPDLPRSPTGKVLKRVLAEQLNAQ
jgi:long-chain acyl-CoA synthetase